MKFIHTGDLHIGKIVNGFSMLEDQKYILDQIVESAVSNEVDGCIIAGDVYDRAIPPAEAISLFSSFLTRLAQARIKLFIISGNHDSPERISFGEEIFRKQSVYMTGAWQGKLSQVTLADEYGEVTFILMPFVKAQYLQAATGKEAVKRMLDTARAGEKGGRKVLVTHYFVTHNGREPELSDGETTIHIGGLDNVESDLFRGFDYVALGHIHKPQQIGGHNIRYAGAPLQYSFSEAGQVKSICLVTLKEKGNVLAENIPLTPRHPMRKIRGSLEELLQAGIRDAQSKDYIQAILTDKEELIDPIGSLRSVYGNIMQIVMEKTLLREDADKQEQRTGSMAENRNMLEMFEEFYEIVREEPLDEERRRIVEEITKEILNEG